MDLFLLILSAILIISGIIGSFMPIVPGPLTSWFGLFSLNLISTVEIDKTLLIITFIIALIIFVLDSLIPIYGSKYFGATKYGILGASIGLLIGIITPIPFGIIIGPILGALIGELLFNNDLKKSIKSSIGVLIGFLASTFIKFITSLIYLMIYLVQLWEYI
ncbi:MAG: DUF456 domain-containing protein [Flavobacteriaceae bacterium]|nr:DUF456 domain-containing protein [Flavobacteriaceae bacterium]MBT4112777.1 DUF456 domain-containing protein [Flavobacteriaceae bacterium]MBT4613652.1 DUF456 domain-containing protein [Flavobacteriaceae bacterium]MBT5246536.1 DUF456 domain-containing protein [Flavobacteriaceae bacterium]MBT5649648.1 DUF456 domain-containing protein [Flavobacteriaceae bacterium]